LFWTVALSPDSVQVNLGAGTARLHVEDLELEDYHDIVNALHDGPSVEATASFDVRWSGVTSRFKVRDAAVDFAGQFIEGTASIAWSAAEDGFSFVSDPADSSTSVVAIIGHERNGVFFP
jgi:hypothetical protein